jgi:hypothetical protein
MNKQLIAFNCKAIRFFKSKNKAGCYWHQNSIGIIRRKANSNVIPIDPGK